MDCLTDANLFEEAEVLDVVFIDDIPEVCDITVDDNHNLFVASSKEELAILCHNCLDENRKSLHKDGAASFAAKKPKPFALETIELSYG